MTCWDCNRARARAPPGAEAVYLLLPVGLGELPGARGVRGCPLLATGRMRSCCLLRMYHHAHDSIKPWPGASWDCKLCSPHRPLRRAGTQKNSRKQPAWAGIAASGCDSGEQPARSVGACCFSAPLRGKGKVRAAMHCSKPPAAPPLEEDEEAAALCSSSEAEAEAGVAAAAGPADGELRQRAAAGGEQRRW